MVRLPAFRSAVVVVAASLAVAAIARAADIPALVSQLGADDYRARERAGAELLGLGQQGVPHLRAALAKSTDPEATRRLEVLVERLESIRATEPTRVTWKVEQKPAKEVFDELARRTGFAFTFLDAPRSAPVSFDWRGTPFLQVLDQLCDALKLSWGIEEASHRIVVQGGHDGERHDPHVTYSGPFRASANSIDLKRELPLAALPRRGVALAAPGLLTLKFSVSSEPRLPAAILGPPVVLAAEDEFGNSLKLAEPNAGWPELSTPLSFTHDGPAVVTLGRASRLAESVRSCRVRVAVACVTARPPEIVVPDVAASRGQKFTGRRHLLEVGDTCREKDHLAVKIVVTNRQALSPNTRDIPYWRATLRGRFEAFDEGGNLLELACGDTADGGPTLECLLNISRFGGGRPKAVKLHFVEWVVKYQTVEFTFKDLPMP